MPEEVPIEADSSAFLDPMLRRYVFVEPADACPGSPKAAAIAAAALAAVDEVILFRRLMRWEGLAAPRETECECCREVTECRGRLPDIGREGGISCTG
jgi:hypothetical protein